MLIRTSLFLTLMLLLSVPIHAQPPTKIGTGTISGRVTLKGEPAAGVSVGLQPQQSGPGGAPYVPDRSKYSRVKTDNEGRFSFSSLTAGQYRIVALASGFVSADDSQLVNGKMVTLTDGENLENVELRLKRGAVITGRVTDPSSNPVIEKSVRLMKLDARGNFSPFNINGEMTRTDDRGVYRIYSLPAGKYKVSMGVPPEAGAGVPDMSRLYFAQTFHPDTTDEKQAKIIELSEGSEATDIDIKITESKKTYDISGRVIEAATGQPVAGIRLGYGTVMPNGRIMNSFGGMASTDAQGEYQIQGVLPGKYAVFADSRFDSQTTDFYSDQTQVEVTDGDLAGVEIKAHRGGSVSGIAVVEGTNDPAILKQLSSLNLNLIYRSSDAGMSRSAKPGPGGNFRFSGVKPGKADIKAFTPGDGLKQIRIEYNGAPITDGLELQQGENIANLRIVFGYGTGIVRGQLKIVGGELPANTQFTLITKFLGGSGSEFYTQVDARNQFVLKSLPPGEYELTLRAFTPIRTPELTKVLGFMNKRTHRVMVGNSEMQTEFVIDLSQVENDK